MLRVKKIFTFVLTVMAFSWLSYASEIFIAARGGYFNPREQDFKDIYGRGMVYGGELNISVGKWIDVWAGADYFHRKGRLTLSGEETEIQIVPLYGGVKFRLVESIINPYLGLAMGYFLYREESPLGTVEDGDIGCIGQIGCRIEIEEGVFFDAQGAYTSCTVRPANVRANLGGWQIGLGVGFEFEF